MSDREILRLPQHRNPGTDRTASAPYNFLPLPEVVVTAVNDARRLPNHDTYENEGYPHGCYFEVTLETKSPLYIRGMLSARREPGKTRSEFEQAEAEKLGLDAPGDFRDAMKNKPEFFYARDPSQPVIPGSSLRGMLRSLLEIVSYGKMNRVTDKQLFFRTVDDTAVGKHYRSRMGDHVETGFLQHTQDGYVIVTCHMARVRRELLGGDPYEGRAPNKTPRWRGKPRQHAKVWVRLTNNRRFVESIDHDDRKIADGEEGRLVITGDIPGKKKEFVFLLPDKSSERIPVCEEVIEQFHDNDQITQWQQRAFPKDQPRSESRERDGLLPSNLDDLGEPVFFLRETSAEADTHDETNDKRKLTFVGRARMFRLPYRNNPLKGLVPDDLRRPEDIDYADALFGFVRTSDEIKALKEKHGLTDDDLKQGSKVRAYAGRVFVTDAVLADGQTDIWLSETPIVPKILATPKPTAFQHYLVQPSDRKDSLKHYDSDSPEDTVLRGHKRYWHQGERRVKDLLPEPDSPNVDSQGRVDPKSTQHTQFRPVKSGVKFRFRVYFESVSDAELGALCWILHPLGDSAQTYCHSLGMGKPLGMGAVKLDAVLYLDDRAARYSTLFDDRGWQLANSEGQRLADRATLEHLTQAFERHILTELNLFPEHQHLFEVRRVAMLLKMMEWPGYPPQLPASSTNRVVKGRDGRRPNTRTMLVQLNEGGRRINEFRDRYVLPDPSAFGTLTGKAEPTAREESAAQVRPVTKTYAVGDVFTGTVVQLLANGNVAIVPPDVDPEQGYAVIAASELAGKTFKLGNLARCEVTRVGRDKRGRTVYHCRPAGKPRT